MKRKTPAPPETVEVPPPVLPVAKASESAKLGMKCTVCGGDSGVAGEDQLCWVCRHLKISAWRDTDHQLPQVE